MTSLCLLNQIPNPPPPSLSLCGQQKGNNAKNPEDGHLPPPLSYYSTFSMCRSQHDGKTCHCSCLWLYRLAPLSLLRDKPIPTLIISTSLLIFLREAFCAITGTVSVNTPQEFALGPPPASLRRCSSSLPEGHVPSSFSPQSTKHLSAATDEGRCGNVEEWTSAQVCTTILILLMIVRICSPTLTSGIHGQIWLTVEQLASGANGGVEPQRFDIDQV